MAVEDHGSGHQYVRIAAWPRYSKIPVALGVAGATTAGMAAYSSKFIVATSLACGSLALFGGAVLEAGRSLANILAAGRQTEATVKEKAALVFESGIKAHRAEL